MDRALSLVLVASLCAACVPVPAGQLPPDTRVVPASRFAPPTGGTDITSLHFTVTAYDAALAKRVSDAAEADYQRIMMDTNLYSFMGDRPYPIYLYENRQEYMEKTGMPQWSSGAETGDTIAVYPSDQLEATLAHEMTHVIFFDVFGSRVGDFIWLNEGLAMYEESKANLSAAEQASLSFGRTSMSVAPLPFAQMIAFTPMSEQDKLVSLWYFQVADVVRFMIETGGRIGFSIFLKDMAAGRDLNNALLDGFGSYGQWRDQATLETAWKSSLKS